MSYEKQYNLNDYTEDNKTNWKAYNKSQTKEKLLFYPLLDELLRVVDTEGDLENGRSSGNYSHRIFCMCIKIYERMSARRSMSDIEMCKRMKFIKKAPCFNSVLNYFKDSNLKKVLLYLIELSALPLYQLERKCAIDASGIGINRYNSRWSNVRQSHSKHKEYKKLHVVYGVLTNVALSCKVTEGTAADSPQFKELLKRAADNFDLSEVSADKAYLSKANIDLSFNLGMLPLIPFKSNSTGKARGCPNFKKAYDFFENRPDEFWNKYHLRSNAETGFWMVEAKFGKHLMTKGEISQINEALCIMLCHNICVLIKSIFLHNIKIDFPHIVKNFVAQKEN